jgi:hypothetical protein
LFDKAGQCKSKGKVKGKVKGKSVCVFNRTQVAKSGFSLDPTLSNPKVLPVTVLIDRFTLLGELAA